VQRSCQSEPPIGDGFGAWTPISKMRTRTRAGSAGAAFERVEEALHNAVELIRKLPEHIELTEYSQR